MTPELARLRAELASARHQALMNRIHQDRLAEKLAEAERRVNDVEHRLIEASYSREDHMKFRLVPKLCPFHCPSGWVHGWKDCDAKMTGFTVLGLGVFWR